MEGIRNGVSEMGSMRMGKRKVGMGGLRSI